MSLILTNYFVVRHTLHVLRSEVKNTSLAATYVKSHLLMLGSLDIYRRKRVISTSFRAVLFAGGRPRFFMHTVATSGADALADAGLASSDVSRNVRNILLQCKSIHYLMFNV